MFQLQNRFLATRFLIIIPKLLIGMKWIFVFHIWNSEKKTTCVMAKVVHIAPQEFSIKWKWIIEVFQLHTRNLKYQCLPYLVTDILSLNKGIYYLNFLVSFLIRSTENFLERIVQWAMVVVGRGKKWIVTIYILFYNFFRIF